MPAEYVGNGNPDGTIVGRVAAEKIGFWGKSPVAQRTFSSAVHVSSNVSTSTSWQAAIQEIIATLTALGIYASA